MKRRLAILFAAALVSVLGAAACREGVQEDMKKRAQEEVQKGQQEMEEKVQEGQQKVEKKVQEGHKKVEEGQ